MFRNVLYPVIFVLGLIAVVWIGAGYVGSNLPALAVTLLIAACYITGTLELHRYRQATDTLTRATDDAAAALSHLGDWLQRLHPGLRNAVRLRVEGERIALPAPALTPYLVGMLVLLGMLGTLMGMMATLRGTGLALDSATDLEAIRGSLGAPIKGLAFAFGTSIAGVSASAMLGLLSALCRRERTQAVQQLDLHLATTLRPYSHAHQREESFRLLQQQTSQMPVLIERLESMAATLEQSMKAGISESAQAIGATLAPIVETTMAGLVRENATLHATVTQAVQQQLDGVAVNLETATAATADTWKAATVEQGRANDSLLQGLRSSLDQFSSSFEQRSSALIETVSTQLESRDDQRLAQWSDALSTITANLDSRWRESSDHVSSRQQEICDTLSRTATEMSIQAQAHAKDTITEIGRLMHAASEAPKAAADVISELRQNLSDSLVRDNAMLEERNQLLATLETLLDAVNHASVEQRTSVDALVSTSADLLERVGSRLTEQIESQTGKLDTAAAHITTGAVEVASLGDALGTVVEQFGATTDALGERLQQIEAALDKSLARSDEQLAYYVAQAREVIDLSMLSQKQIVGELQQLAGAPASAAQGKSPA